MSKLDLGRQAGRGELRGEAKTQRHVYNAAAVIDSTERAVQSTRHGIRVLSTRYRVRSTEYTVPSTR
jgi:hypothetical protein